MSSQNIKQKNIQVVKKIVNKKPYFNSYKLQYKQIYLKAKTHTFRAVLSE